MSQPDTDGATTYVDVEIVPPLADCIRVCETECVRDCCGIDAIRVDPAAIAAWAKRAGLEVASTARDQLDGLIAVVMDRSRQVSCDFLNFVTVTEEARVEVLSLLNAFHQALAEVDHPG